MKSFFTETVHSSDFALWPVTKTFSCCVWFSAFMTSPCWEPSWIPPPWRTAASKLRRASVHRFTQSALDLVKTWPVNGLYCMIGGVTDLKFLQNIDELQLFLESNNQFCFLFFEHFVFSQYNFFTLLFRTQLVLI